MTDFCANLGSVTNVLVASEKTLNVPDQKNKDGIIHAARLLWSSWGIAWPASGTTKHTQITSLPYPLIAISPCHITIHMWAFASGFLSTSHSNSISYLWETLNIWTKWTFQLNKGRTSYGLVTVQNIKLYSGLYLHGYFKIQCPSSLQFLKQNRVIQSISSIDLGDMGFKQRLDTSWLLNFGQSPSNNLVW